MMDIQHGEVSIILKDNIIVATLIGAFNKKGAVEYTEGVKNLVKKLNDNKYAILVDNSCMEGGTPEAYQVLENYNQWLNKTNLVAKAMVVKTTITADLIQTLSPSVKLQTTKTFHDKTLAFKWLEKMIS
jgi:hypothetical protein